MAFENISLVSNTLVKDYYEDNKTSDYRCHFPQELVYERGQYEIAMTSFQYKKSWDNFPDTDKFIIDVYTKRYADGNDGKILKLARINFPSGHYATGKEVADAMNAIFQTHDLSSLVEMEFNELAHKTAFRFKAGLGRDFISLYFLRPFARKLGFTGKPDGTYEEFDVYFGRAHTVLSSPSVLTLEEIDHLFVYLDMCQNKHIVGDVASSVLQIVPNKGKRGDVVIFEPRSLLWLPLNSSRFTSARVLINDQRGRPVPFTSGTSIVRVHIRLANPFK